MQASEIKLGIARKRLEYDLACEAGKPHDELRRIYQEIKQLQFDLLQAELAEKNETLLTEKERF